MSPSLAAQVWVNTIVPLQEMGIKAGMPAVSSAPNGLEWLKNFMLECDHVIGQRNSVVKNCTYDFVPLHYYGTFDGLASYIGEFIAT